MLRYMLVIAFAFTVIANAAEKKNVLFIAVELSGDSH